MQRLRAQGVFSLTQRSIPWLNNMVQLPIGRNLRRGQDTCGFNLQQQCGAIGPLEEPGPAYLKPESIDSNGQQDRNI